MWPWEDYTLTGKHNAGLLQGCAPGENLDAEAKSYTMAFPGRSPLSQGAAPAAIARRDLGDTGWFLSMAGEENEITNFLLCLVFWCQYPNFAQAGYD